MEKQHKSDAVDDDDDDKQCKTNLTDYNILTINETLYIGAGMYGAVYRVVGKNKQQYALKWIPLLGDEQQGFNELNSLRRLQTTGVVPRVWKHWICACKNADNLRQIGLEKKLEYLAKHKRKDIEVDPLLGSTSECLFILMDLYEKPFDTLLPHPENNMSLIAHALITLAKLSKEMCVHGDLRPEHILYKTSNDLLSAQINGKKNTDFGIIDFGFARFLNPLSTKTQHVPTGWVHHVFPNIPATIELRLANSDSQENKIRKCRVFAMFVNCLQLFAFMKVKPKEWYWLDKQNVKRYFDGFSCTKYQDWIKEWSNGLPFSIETLGLGPLSGDQNAYVFKFPFHSILESAGIH
jgi:hypothetical protein